MELIFFEWKKLLKRKTTWIAISFSVLAVVAFYFINYSVAQNIYKSTISRVETYILEYPELIAQLENHLEEAKEKKDTQQIEMIGFQITNMQNSYEKSQFLLEGYQREDWSKVYPYILEILEKTIDMPDPHMNIPYDIDGQPGSWFTVRVAYEETKYLFEKNMAPFIQVEQRYRPYLATIYEEFEGSAVKEWKQLTFRYGITGLYFLYQITQFFYIPIIFLIACFLFGNTVSLESGKKKRGLNFYAVLPVSKGKLFFVKYVSGLVLTFGFYIMMMAVPLIVSLFAKGMGNPAYPVLIYEGSSRTDILDGLNDHFKFIELGDYFIQALLLGVILGFFIYSLYFLIALFIKNPALILAILGTIVIFGMIVIPVSPFNPFTYVDLHQVLNGAIATREFNSAINLLNGALLLLVMGSLFTFLGYKKFAHTILFKKKIKNT